MNRHADSDACRRAAKTAGYDDEQRLACEDADLKCPLCPWNTDCQDCGVDVNPETAVRKNCDKCSRVLCETCYDNVQRGKCSACTRRVPGFEDGKVEREEVD